MNKMIHEQIGQGIPGVADFRDFIICPCGETQTIMGTRDERFYLAGIFLDKHLDCRIKE